MPADDATLARVKELYVSCTIAEDRENFSPPVPFADIVAFFLEAKPLSPVQQARLFRNPHLRDQFQRLKNDLAWRRRATDTLRQDGAVGTRIVCLPPARAAANDAPLTTREFDEGTLSLVQSAVAHHVYVVIKLKDPRHPPSRLVMESRPEREAASAALPAPDPDGAIRLLRNSNEEPDATLLRLLRTPTSQGTFIA